MHDDPSNQESPSGGRTWSAVDAEGTILAATYTCVGPTRTVIVDLGEQGFIVFSPGEELAERGSEVIPAGARVTLVAPSAAHTLGLRRWLEVFPGARVVAERRAIPRISKKTGLDVEEVGLLELPAWVTLERPGSRMGEVWFRVDRGGKSYWLVCDALINAPSLTGNLLVRGLKKLYRLGPGLEMTRLFAMSIRDKRGFRRFVRERFAPDRAHVLVPCHGSIADDAELGARVIALVDKRL